MILSSRFKKKFLNSIQDFVNKGEQKENARNTLKLKPNKQHKNLRHTLGTSVLLKFYNSQILHINR